MRSQFFGKTVRWLTVMAGLSAAVMAQGDDELQPLLAAQTEKQREAAVAGRDLAQLVQALKRMGAANYQRAAFGPALERYRLAAWVADKTGDVKTMAGCQESIGMALQRLGDYPGALDAYGKALHLALGAGLQAMAASAHLSLSFILRNQGEYERALEHIRDADVSFAELKDRLGIARTASAYGSVYSAAGDYRKAADATQRALELAEELKNAQGIALQLNNLALIYSLQGDYELALPYARRALAMKTAAGNEADALRSRLLVGRLQAGLRNFGAAKEALTQGLKQAEKAGDLALVGGTLTELGGIAAEEGEWEVALAYAKKAVQTLEAMGNGEQVPDSLAEQARYELALGKVGDAVASAKRVLQLLGPEGELLSIAVAETVLGKAAAGQGDRVGAREHLQRAIEAAEAKRAVSVGADADQQTRDAHLEAFHELARLAIAEGKFEEALQVAEQARARRLLGLVQSRRSVLSSLTAAEKKKEESLRARMKGPNWRAARAEHEQFRAELYRKHPEMQVLGSQAVGVAPVRAWLRKAKCVAVEYIFMKKEVWALLVTGERVRAFRVGNAAEIGTLAGAFRESVAGRDPGYRKRGERLYAMLIAPIQEQLRGATRLVIAPDGPLWGLPFEALQSMDGSFLLDHAGVSYLPSLAVGAELFGRAGTTGTGALGVGVLGGKEMAGMTRIRTGVEFRAEAGKYGVIHVASHGVFDDHGPMYSYLQLEDGNLAAWEILRLRLRADLVVLAACETARGQVSQGEGAIGMSWAFLAAGARAVVASGWKVDSEATGTLMTTFHGRRGPGALRSAALALRADERWRHPYYWAGFSVLGIGY